MGSGQHAEMWSVFAVGCIQDPPKSTEGEESTQEMSPNQLYDVVKLLIPNELGNLDLNHVKALLNLAVFNISRSLFSSAWLLVGAASRIFLTLDTLPECVTPRRKNILSSCFLLDNLLSLHMKQRPYLDKFDLSMVGRIEEDGMEEWQPWDGTLRSGKLSQSRTPTLALSSLNSLLEAVDILVSATRQSSARNFLHEMIGRLEVWKSTLPNKLAYVRLETTTIPLTPPAILLQMTYFVTAFALVPSQAGLLRITDLLSEIKENLGFRRVPPILICLLQNVRDYSLNLAVDQATRGRMLRLFVELDQAYSANRGDIVNSLEIQPIASPNRTHLQDSDVTQASPRSLQSRGDATAQTNIPSIGSSTLLDDLLPDMNASRQRNTSQTLPSRPFESTFDPSSFDPSSLEPSDPYSAFNAGDLESFFDDLASIHGAKKLQNQPQFMQNLGYSSEVSMADLLATDPGRFMPLPTSSNFEPENNDQSPHFPVNTFYDAG